MNRHRVGAVPAVHCCTPRARHAAARPRGRAGRLGLGLGRRTDDESDAGGRHALGLPLRRQRHHLERAGGLPQDHGSAAGVTSVSLCAYRVETDGSFGYQTAPYGPAGCGLNQEKWIMPISEKTGLAQYPLIDNHAGIDSVRVVKCYAHC